MNRSKTFFSVFLILIGTGGYALTPYSTEELDELEKVFVQQINQSSSVERNPLANQYINHLGKQLAQNAHLSDPHFFIVKSPEINAFAGPGGHIGINTALILATENESELAAVMAHELAHVRLHHLYRFIQHEKQMRIPMLASLLAAAALSVVNPTLGSGALAASMTGFAQSNINFTRSNEKEADSIGMDMLIKAELNPRAMVSFFQKMQQQSRYYYTANIPAILRTHPLDETRIAEAENRSFKIAKKNYPSTLDYFLFKETVRNAVTPPKVLVDYYQHCRPQSAPVCSYGYALALINLNQFKSAFTYLKPLYEQDPSNFFFYLAYMQAKSGYEGEQAVTESLKQMYQNYPNYAFLMAYTQNLSNNGQFKEAIALLLKGFRIFKQDLPLCESLARTQGKAHQPTYAYFTQAQCYLLQGLDREAYRQLKHVQSLKPDAYLKARTDALMEEIKFKQS